MQSLLNDAMENLIRMGFSKEFIFAVLLFFVVMVFLQSLSGKIKRLLIKMSTLTSQTSNLIHSTADQMVKDEERTKSLIDVNKTIEKSISSQERASEITNSKTVNYMNAVDDKIENLNDSLKEMKKILILWTNK